MALLIGNKRGGAMDLAVHLLNPENEHVEIHEVSGFLSGDVREAFKEAEAISKGTKCFQHMFSLSINPPPTESVAIEVFEQTIANAEKSLNLQGQPRIIVFHEKEGRRHAHCVWSRIDTDQMKAIDQPFYKNKLTDLSLQTFIEHGWTVPDGLRNREKRNPLNFSMAEWQQSKRSGKDPRVIRWIIQECWEVSDSKKAFANALHEYGFILARGDRRGFVAVDHQGTVYSIADKVGIKTKLVKIKLGKTDDLPSVKETKDYFSRTVTQKLKGFIAEAENKASHIITGLSHKSRAMAKVHHAERQSLREKQDQRRFAEMRIRTDRLRKGVLGVWDWMTGRRAKTKSQNSLETYWSWQRDQKQKQDLIDQQLSERRILQKQINQVRFQQSKIQTRLYRDIGFYVRLNLEDQEKALDLRLQTKHRRARNQYTNHSPTMKGPKL